MAWIILGLYSTLFFIGIHTGYQIHQLNKLEKEKKPALVPTPTTEYIFRAIQEGKIQCHTVNEATSSWNAKKALESYRSSSMTENIRVIQELKMERRI